MSRLDFANHFLSNQRLHAWSWINRTFPREWFVFCGEFGFECSWPSPFLFILVRSEQVTDARDFGWQPKGGDHFRSWFPFSFVYLVTTLYYSDVVWSKDLSTYFFCFLPILDREFSFFCFLPIFDWELSPFLSFLPFFFFLFWFLLRARFMVSWDFGSRHVERMDMIYVRVLV